MRNRLVAVFLAVLLMVCAGCGPTGCGVRGQVQFRGAPLPSGSIAFEPETNVNSPSTLVPIANGIYTVPANKKLTSGKYRVQILGPLPDHDNPVPPSLIFPTYMTTTDLPPGDSIRDFEVPTP